MVSFSLDLGAQTHTSHSPGENIFSLPTHLPVSHTALSYRPLPDPRHPSSLHLNNLNPPTPPLPSCGVAHDDVRGDFDKNLPVHPTACARPRDHVITAPLATHHNTISVSSTLLSCCNSKIDITITPRTTGAVPRAAPPPFPLGTASCAPEDMVPLPYHRRPRFNTPPSLAVTVAVAGWSAVCMPHQRLVATSDTPRLGR